MRITHTSRNTIVWLALMPALAIGARGALAQAPAAPAVGSPTTTSSPAQGRGGAPAGRGAPAAPARGASPTGMGPNDKPAVDPAAADRGRRVYAGQCINCHGTQARGSDTGANLVRSTLVLHDRYGSELGPFLKKGHPMQSGAPSTTLTDEQVTDLAHFLRQRLNDTLRGSPIFEAQDVLTGDAKAGATFFNGPGGCTACHSATGNLAGIGRRYDPVTVQQRFLFPPGPARGRGAATTAAVSPIAVRVTVTPAGGTPVSGVLIQMDDFTVALRDANGTYLSFRRTPALTVEKTVPLAAHIALLETITDKQMHDVVAYLETLK